MNYSNEVNTGRISDLEELLRGSEAPQGCISVALKNFSTAWITIVLSCILQRLPGFPPSPI